MRVFWVILAVSITLVGRADEPRVTLVQETWDAAYLDGVKAGYFHSTLHMVERDGGTVHRFTQKMHLTVRRFGETARTEAVIGDETTPEGKLVGVFMSQSLGQNQRLELTGKVEGKSLKVRVQGSTGTFERSIPWPDDVISLLAEQNLPRDRKLKPGERISYRQFQPIVNNVIKVDMTVGDYENVVLNGVARKCLRVESKPEKIELKGEDGKVQVIQLPGLTTWLDSQYAVIKSESQMPGLGKVTLERTTKAIALADAGAVKDIGVSQSIVLNRDIPFAHRQVKVVYRITMPDDESPAETFSTGDGRQEVKNVNGKSFELHVRSVREPEKAVGKQVGEEFLKSNFFVNSDDVMVRRHAEEAIGKETDPWKKAQNIELWVRRKMRVLNFESAMVPADKVARTLEGDCTEYAMLTAAMCRAAGVPSRTALGLVYTKDRRNTPILAYHMWTEVAIGGQWLALDATIGDGSVGPAHLKIADHSWHEMRALTPLLPVLRVLSGKPKVEVLKIESSETPKPVRPTSFAPESANSDAAKAVQVISEPVAGTAPIRWRVVRFGFTRRR
jgi:hypothetical protein